MISQSLPDRDVRILDAEHFDDGPDSLAAMLGFLGADTCVAPAATAAGEPGRPERVDDAA